MDNDISSLWDDLAIVFNDEENIDLIISELFQSNYPQLKSLEALTISGNTLIGSSSTKLHIIGTSSGRYLAEGSPSAVFHELDNIANSKELTNILSINNVRAKNLQIFLRGKSNRFFSSLPSEICKLNNLKDLSINVTFLKNIPPEVENLQKLESLNLSNNSLSSLPKGVENLINLKQLYLRKNPFEKLPINILVLSNLQYLNLDSTQINELPGDLYKLANLRSLNLNNTNISVFPLQVTEIDSLLRLDINHNKLTTLPTEIKKFKKLTHLYASNNNIGSLPSEIHHLEALRYFDISNNLLTSLPRDILLLRHLESLNVRNNKLDLPPEILEKTNEPDAILFAYFGVEAFTARRMRTINEFREILAPDAILIQRNALLEAKVPILGQGSVGKTSLVQQILHGTFEPNQTITEGISINQWQVEGSQKQELDALPEHIKLNIWDFGGQEIMHATHQFFLTKRSLYLLVLDARLTQEENRVEYWLKIIQSFGGESPVLIVGNKIDQHPLDIDRTGLQKKYPNVVGILETSAATGAGIEELKAAITEQVNNLPHVRDLLPETWFTVKTKLEGLGRQSNFITHDKYLELCAENEVSDETSQRTLIGFLHDLGVVLHFQDDPRLEALGILNPQWVTNGVYKILNSHTLFQNKGVLTTSMLDEILNLPEYPRGKRLFIVDMMKKFELCYEINPDKTFLVPDLLPKDEPAELKFNGVPAFEYAYPVLPSSIITRFIVRMNQKIDDGFVWRTGVVLKIGENIALVKADIEDRKITIAIDGLEHTRRDALSAIRYQLDEIHASIKGLDAQKRVPIPNAPNAESLEYETLLMLESEGQEEYLVRDGKRLVKVNVRQILSGIESETQRKETASRVINIYGDVKDSNILAGDENEVNK